MRHMAEDRVDSATISLVEPTRKPPWQKRVLGVVVAVVIGLTIALVTAVVVRKLGKDDSYYPNVNNQFIALRASLRGTSEGVPTRKQLIIALVDWSGHDVDAVAVGQVFPVPPLGWEAGFVIKGLDKNKAQNLQKIFVGAMPRSLQQLGAGSILAASLVPGVVGELQFGCITDLPIVGQSAKQTWCCAQDRLLCRTEPYSCTKVPGETWPRERTHWCCQNKGVECKAEVLMYDCDSDSARWSPAHAAWCCENARKGCRPSDANASPPPNPFAELDAYLPLPLTLSTIVTKQMVQRRQSLTIVFNRAVIPLGSNFAPVDSSKALQVHGVDPLLWQCQGQDRGATPPVPGRARWVTTSILRFDPNEDWATDLHCELSVNPELRTFDGTKLAPTTIKARFKTPALTMHLLTVESEAAQNATSGLWAARVGNQRVPECPPDAVVTLRFNAKVDASRLQGHLAIVDQAGVRRPVTIIPDAECAPCATLRVRLPEVEKYQEYQIQMPVGMEVNAFAGPTTKPLQAPVMGLRPFTIPWMSSKWMKLSQNNQRIWIPHGIPESTDLQKLRAALSFDPPIGFLLSELSVGKFPVRTLCVQPSGLLVHRDTCTAL